MGFASYNSKDRDNNTGMFDNLSSMYGRNYINSTKIRTSYRTDPPSIDYHRVYFAKEKYPCEYEIEFREAAHKLLDAYIQGERNYQTYLIDIIEITKRAYNLDYVYYRKDEVDLETPKLAKEKRRKAIEVLEMLYSCRGEGMRAMNRDDRKFVSTYPLIKEEIKQEIAVLSEKLKFYSKTMEDALKSGVQSGSMDSLRKMIDEYKESLKNKENELKEISSAENEQRFSRLVLQAIYGIYAGEKPKE